MWGQCAEFGAVCRGHLSGGPWARLDRMRTPPRPLGESDRLQRLRELFVLDSEPEPVFDSIALLASQVCGVPIALISLIDGERQWFKANVGLPGINETPRDVAFCAHAILEDALFEVPDACADARFSDNPLVTGQPDIRFYAGAPLILPDGERVGTLCVIDRAARRLDPQQAAMLRSLAQVATEALLMRRDLVTKTLSVRTGYEQALAASAAELADLYDNAPCGYHSLDAQGRIVRINETALRWLGCTRAEVAQGLSMIDFLTESGQRAFRETFPRVMAEGAAGFEFDLVSRSGEVRHLIASASSIRDADGRFVMSRTVTLDMTELQRAREQLQHAELVRMRAQVLEAENRQLLEANRFKGMLLSNISHELRTPLNAVLGYAQLLLAGGAQPGSPQFARYVERIDASGKELLALIDTVLNFAQVESGKFELAPVPTRLKAVIGEVVETQLPQAQARQIVFDVQVDDTIDAVVLDPLRLAQIVSTYVANAIKFSHAGGRVRIRAQPDGERDFRIEVEDSGIGIAAADLPRLFTTFQQLSEGSTKHYGGAGLGLALARKLAEAQGGSTDATSEWGVGSVFSVVLPREAGRPQPTVRVLRASPARDPGTPR